MVTMIKILFICHGNICRSPMAEFIMKNLISKKHVQSYFFIDSCATSQEEIGNGLYPYAKDILLKHNIPIYQHSARQITLSDYDYFDYLLVMENYNLHNLKRIIPTDPQKKIFRLLDFTNFPTDISDPWYSGDFETAYQEITKGCQALLEYIEKKNLSK